MTRSNWTLFRDYATNSGRCTPNFTTTSGIAGCHCWRYGDVVTRSSAPPGRGAFSADLPDAEVHLLEGWTLPPESALDEVVALMTDFLARRLAVR